MSFGKTRRLIYHFVINPKYRKPLLTGEKAKLLQEVLESLCEKLEITILALAIEPDHVHLLLDVPTTRSVSDVMMRLKWWTSIRLRTKYPELKSLPALWSRRYFVRMVAASGDAAAVEKYIKKQGWIKKGVDRKE